MTTYPNAISPTDAAAYHPAPVPGLRATPGERVAAAALALACGSLLGLAGWLTPSVNGVGTHQALGLPPCGWVASMNMPCPSCGMTTAFSHAARGSLLSSFLVQPMGALLALATATTFVVATYVLFTGSMVGHSLAARITPRVLLMLGIFAVFAWGYKILLHRGYLPLIAPGY